MKNLIFIVCVFLLGCYKTSENDSGSNYLLNDLSDKSDGEIGKPPLDNQSECFEGMSHLDVYNSYDKKNGSKSGSIYLGFDDYYDNWNILIPKFKCRPVRFTFFINTWSNLITELLEQGHSVGNHTRSHINLAQSKDNWVTTLEYEIVSFNDEIKEHTEVKSFAFPFGAFNTHWTAVLVEHFSHLRRFGTRNNNPVFYPKNNLTGQVILSSSSLDNVKFSSDLEYFQYVDNLIEELLKNKGSVVLTAHDIGLSDWAISEERLEYLVDKAIKNNINFKTL